MFDYRLNDLVNRKSELDLVVLGLVGLVYAHQDLDDFFVASVDVNVPEH